MQCKNVTLSVLVCMSDTDTQNHARQRLVTATGGSAHQGLASSRKSPGCISSASAVLYPLAGLCPSLLATTCAVSTECAFKRYSSLLFCPFTVTWEATSVFLWTPTVLKYNSGPAVSIDVESISSRNQYSSNLADDSLIKKQNKKH